MSNLVAAKFKKEPFRLTPTVSLESLLEELATLLPVDKLYLCIPDETGFRFVEAGNLVVSFVPTNHAVELPELPKVVATPPQPTSPVLAETPIEPQQEVSSLPEKKRMGRPFGSKNKGGRPPYGANSPIKQTAVVIRTDDPKTEQMDLEFLFDKPKSQSELSGETLNGGPVERILERESEHAN